MARRSDPRRVSRTTRSRVSAPSPDETRDLDGTTRAADPEMLTMPLSAEHIVVTTPVAATGRVSIRRITRVDAEPIAVTLARHTIDVTRVPVGREVESVPSIREEGDTLVLPVVEERLVIERQLFLKEEVRVRRRCIRTVHRETIPLRHHDVVITRSPIDQPAEAPTSGG